MTLHKPLNLTRLNIVTNQVPMSVSLKAAHILLLSSQPRSKTTKDRRGIPCPYIMEFKASCQLAVIFFIFL